MAGQTRGVGENTRAGACERWPKGGTAGPNESRRPRVPSLKLWPGSAASLFFFNDRGTTEIYPLPLHDALPICLALVARQDPHRGVEGTAGCGRAIIGA